MVVWPSIYHSRPPWNLVAPLLPFPTAPIPDPPDLERHEVSHVTPCPSPRDSLIPPTAVRPDIFLPSYVPSQLRNVVFAVVAQRAIRRVARDVFEHLHDLDLSYHLAKNTGTVGRIIDRGGELDDFSSNRTRGQGAEASATTTTMCDSHA